MIGFFLLRVLFYTVSLKLIRFSLLLDFYCVAGFIPGPLPPLVWLVPRLNADRGWLFCFKVPWPDNRALRFSRVSSSFLLPGCGVPVCIQTEKKGSKTSGTQLHSNEFIIPFSKHSLVRSFYFKGRLNNLKWKSTVVQQYMTKQVVIQGMQGQQIVHLSVKVLRTLTHITSKWLQ